MILTFFIPISKFNEINLKLNLKFNRVYILPDFSAEYDLTNLRIREILGKENFNSTILSNTDSAKSYPNLRKIETSDVTT